MLFATFSRTIGPNRTTNARDIYNALTRRGGTWCSTSGEALWRETQGEMEGEIGEKMGRNLGRNMENFMHQKWLKRILHYLQTDSGVDLENLGNGTLVRNRNKFYYKTMTKSLLSKHC